MTKSTITREENIQAVFDLKAGYTLGLADVEILKRVARMALAAIDSKPVAYMYRDNLHSDARFSLESKIGNWSPEDINEYEISETPLYRHAQPAPEMKPVGYLFVSEQGAIAYSPTNWGMPGFRLIGQIYGDIDVESQPAPAVPQDVLDALQKVARIRRDLDDFDGDRRGIADCLGDAEEALIEVVNRRAAMLAAAPQEVKGE